MDKAKILSGKDTLYQTIPVCMNETKKALENVGSQDNQH